MAALDVSDVLDDPDFQTFIQWTAYTTTIGAGGIATNTTSGPTIIPAVVIPDGGRDLVQMGDGAMVQGNITVYTRYPLTTGDADSAADQIVWAGSPYTVIQSQPWQYGSGYTRAICKLATVNPADPTQGAPVHHAGALG